MLPKGNLQTQNQPPRRKAKLLLPLKKFDDASNQTELASGSDASTSDAPGSQPTLWEKTLPLFKLILKPLTFQLSKVRLPPCGELGKLLAAM